VDLVASVPIRLWSVFHHGEYGTKNVLGRLLVVAELGGVVGGLQIDPAMTAPVRAGRAPIDNGLSEAGLCNGLLIRRVE
jgi:hypothetical protein